MRKEKLAWWEEDSYSKDLHIRAMGAEGTDDDTTAACIEYKERDYIFFADIKNQSFKAISHKHKEK